jgi:OOP family OmpA-OmpF porin
MRIGKVLFILLLAVALISGCASKGGVDWKVCAVAGAVVGGTAGGIAAGDAGYGILGGSVGGALLGGLLCYLLAEKDSDGDGVPDTLDQCPGTPPGVKVDSVGCPIDTDGDGVPDYLDNCPDTPRGAKVDANGCPTDSDGDGVFDGIDKCPNTPKGAIVDADGCPTDSDKDGVYDGIDQCPNTPCGAVVDSVGCPLDSDNDGVYDGIDECPNTPAEDVVDERGCSIVIRDIIHFDLDKDNIKGSERPKLDNVVILLNNVLQMHPNARVKVEGHTCDIGTPQYNLKLSNKRANSTKHYLVTRGIPGDKLMSIGKGESQPIVPNTASGRPQNRRTEFRLVR